MRTKIYTTIIATCAVFGFAKSLAQSNKSLSNLTAPTSVNQSLLPNSSNSKDLGSSALAWKDIYFSGRLYVNGFTMLHATGTANFFAGNSAGNTTLTGSNNTASGYIALNYNTTGSYNTGMGSWALRSNTTGNDNTGVGYSALWLNSTGNGNTAIGKYAMYYNSTGRSNTAVGNHALYRNTSGFNLVAIGDSAMYNFNTSDYYGGSNTAVGSKSLYATTTGVKNTAVGREALYANTTGSYNTATGFALVSNTTGSYNTANGFTALNASGGSYNTAMGAGAMLGYEGSYNTAVGAYAGGWYDLFNNVSNSTSIGYNADVWQSNQVRIGNEYVTSIGGQVGWTILSDGRFKKDIKENIPGLAFINKLRPVSYKVDTKGLHEYLHKAKEKRGEESDTKENADFDKAAEEAANAVQDGFVAQEVEEAAKKMGFEFNGVDKPKNKDGLYGLRYDNFVVPLVKAVQELSKMNDKKDSLIETLTARIEKLEQAANINPAAATHKIQTVTISGASLEQNTPNPFTNTTAVRYTLPKKFTTAQIVITDMHGKTLKQITVSGAGKGVLNIDAATLSAGAYSYALVVDGRMIASKQMLLGK